MADNCGGGTLDFGCSNIECKPAVNSVDNEKLRLLEMDDQIIDMGGALQIAFASQLGARYCVAVVVIVELCWI